MTRGAPEKKPATLEEGLKQKAYLRTHRARAYRVKQRYPTCQHEGCKQDRYLIVVKVGKGQEDEDYSVRCEYHLGDSPWVPGTWPSRVTDRQIGKGPARG